MRFGHVWLSLVHSYLLGERMTLLSLKQEHTSVHSNGSPLHRFRNLSLSSLELFAVSHEVDKVQGIVEIHLMFHCTTDLTLDFFLVVCFLVLIVDVVDSDFIVLAPQLGNGQLYYFQPVFLLVHCVNEYVVCGGLFVCWTKIEKRKITL